MFYFEEQKMKSEKIQCPKCNNQFLHAHGHLGLICTNCLYEITLHQGPKMSLPLKPYNKIQTIKDLVVNARENISMAFIKTVHDDEKGLVNDRRLKKMLDDATKSLTEIRDYIDSRSVK